MLLQPSGGLLRATKVVLGLGRLQRTCSVMGEGGASPSQAKAIVTSPPAETSVRVGGRCQGLLTSDPPGIEGECGSLIRRPKFKSPKHWRPKFFLILMLIVASTHCSDIRLSLSHLTLRVTLAYTPTFYMLGN